MLIDEDSLKKIEALLKRKIDKPKVKATCADNTEHEFNSVSDLTKYENSKSKRIKSIRFWSVKDGDWTKQARVSFTSYDFRTLDIEVTGTQATAPKLRDDIEEISEGLRAWYWPLYKIDFVSLMFGALFLLWIAANIIVRVQQGALILNDAGSDDALGVLVALAIIAVGSTAHLLRDRLFPRITFLIGQEIGRHRTLERVQWCVVIAFVVSVAAGIATVALT